MLCTVQCIAMDGAQVSSQPASRHLSLKQLLSLFACCGGASEGYGSAEEAALEDLELAKQQQGPTAPRQHKVQTTLEQQEACCEEGLRAGCNTSFAAQHRSRSRLSAAGNRIDEGWDAAADIKSLRRKQHSVANDEGGFCAPGVEPSSSAAVSAAHAAPSPRMSCPGKELLCADLLSKGHRERYYQRVSLGLGPASQGILPPGHSPDPSVHGSAPLPRLPSVSQQVHPLDALAGAVTASPRGSPSRTALTESFSMLAVAASRRQLLADVTAGSLRCSSSGGVMGAAACGQSSNPLCEFVRRSGELSGGLDGVYRQQSMNSMLDMLSGSNEPPNILIFNSALTTGAASRASPKQHPQFAAGASASSSAFATAAAGAPTAGGSGVAVSGSFASTGSAWLSRSRTPSVTRMGSVTPPALRTTSALAGRCGGQ